MLRPTTPAALVLAICAAAGASAQNPVVLPAEFAAVEASSGGSLGGFETRSRQQILVAAQLLQPLRGRVLTGLWVRRNHTLGLPYRGWTTDLKLSLARAARSPAQAARRFADNIDPLSTPVVVFEGSLGLPATGAPPRPAPWDPAFAVHLPFAPPGYLYLGGDLCLDIEGTPQAAPANAVWWVDFAREFEIGRLDRIGTPCGAATAENATTLTAGTRGTRPGATLHVSAYGWPGTLGALLVGALAAPIDLGRLGAPGCSLYVWPLVQLVGVHEPGFQADVFGAMRVGIDIPLSANLLGAQFAMQAVNLEPQAQSNPAGLTTTNAVQVTLASSMPSGRFATITSAPAGAGEPFPSSGAVNLGHGPVLRWETQ